ncbi:MAG: SgcJ/EcaC family oxidoreductase [Haliea sp.]|nr:MAG: SgcJ/EcaC family oxidoreductase [Haliea sp.]
MANDEGQIRALIHEWMRATKAGDVDTVLGLMADDAVFLLPGRPPMDKPAFEAQARAQQAGPAPAFEGSSDIQEIQVAGDWAFAWAQLRMTVTPPGGGVIKRAGHTLTVFHKRQGRWLLARDANLLAPVQR